MKKLRLVLKIVGSLGIAFWIVCFFFGLFFSCNGNPIIAFSITLLIGVLLFLSYFLMLKMQDKETRQTDARRAKIMERIWLGVYLVVALFSAYYVNHLVKTYDNRESVRAKARTAISELRTTFAKDATKDNSYREWVEGKLFTYQTHVEAHPDEYTGDHNLLWAKFNDNLIREGYEDLEKEVNSCVDQVDQTVVNNWYLPRLLQRLNELKQKKGWEEKVVEFSKGHDYTKDDPFVPVSTEDCDDITDGLTQTSFSVIAMSIFIIVAIQLLILLGYLIYLRSGGKQEKIQTSPTGAIRSWSPNHTQKQEQEQE